MRTLTRVRQLTGGYVVQIARLEKHERTQACHWSDWAEFATEREAELCARAISDSQGHGVRDYHLVKPRNASGYWLYPRRDCLVPIG